MTPGRVGARDLPGAAGATSREGVVEPAVLAATTGWLLLKPGVGLGVAAGHPVAVYVAVEATRGRASAGRAAGLARSVVEVSTAPGQAAS